MKANEHINDEGEPTRKVIEWTPGKWWVVDERPGKGYTPIEGPFQTRDEAEIFVNTGMLPGLMDAAENIIRNIAWLGAGFYRTRLTHKQFLTRQRAEAAEQVVRYCLGQFDAEALLDAECRRVDAELEQERNTSASETPFERMFRHIGNAIHKKESHR